MCSLAGINTNGIPHIRFFFTEMAIPGWGRNLFSIGFKKIKTIRLFPTNPLSWDFSNVNVDILSE